MSCHWLLVPCGRFVQSNALYCLDCYNAVLAGLHSIELNRLQGDVQNAAVRLVADVHKYDHVRPLLQDQNWLPIACHIKSTSCVLWLRAVFAAWLQST